MHYIGDRTRKESQLNGKSANLNHVIFTKLYPLVTVAGTLHFRFFTVTVKHVLHARAC